MRCFTVVWLYRSRYGLISLFVRGQVVSIKLQACSRELTTLKGVAAKNLGSSKHSGVLSLFSRHFVKTGCISIESGRHLREAFELRQNCDYREFVDISKAQAEEVIQNAEAFIAEVQKTIVTMKLTKEMKK
ncbi:MAG: antitoxin [Planctomycetota bacterium]|nr:MAG: antitoxin [Planctomycetota bacterium]